MIPHSKPLLGSAEEQAATRVVRSGMLAQGKECEKLEDELAQYLSATQVVVVSSGSAALHLALVGMGIGRGDRVMIPSFVCTALLNAVRHVGGTPSLVDLPTVGYNIEPQDMSEDIACTIVPHMFGKAASINDFDGRIVEDCAMAIGASIGGIKLGTLGECGIFSFYATKVLCAGEGGAICTHDVNLAETIRDIRDYDGRQDDRPRFNYKMTDIQAAIARVQLQSLDRFVSVRRELAGRYDEVLSGCGFALPSFGDEDNPFRYVVRHPEHSAENLQRAFEREGVSARRPVYRPLHSYLDTDRTFPNTDRVFSESVSIPLYPALTEPEINHILAATPKVL